MEGAEETEGRGNWCPIFSSGSISFILLPGSRDSAWSRAIRPKDGNKHDLNNPRLTAPDDRQENYPLGKGASEHVTRGIGGVGGTLVTQGALDVLSLTQALSSEQKRCRQQGEKRQKTEPQVKP